MVLKMSADSVACGFLWNWEGTLIVRLAEQPHGVSHGEVTLLAYRFVPVS